MSTIDEFRPEISVGLWPLLKALHHVQHHFLVRVLTCGCRASSSEDDAATEEGEK